MKKIIPAILTDNVSDLESKLKKLRGLTDWVQIDIMDGKFVNNLSVQLKDLSKTSLLKNFSLEAHLMVFHPEEYFSGSQKIGIKRVIFHFEAVDNLNNVNNVLAKAKKFNFQKGLALNPQTVITKIKPYLGQIDFVLLLAVNPGSQGQKFLPQVLEKIEKLRNLSPGMKIGVDGGINLTNIQMVGAAGADYLVIGSGLFKSKNLKETLKKLKAKIKYA